jgi:hypothetical protein
MGTFNNFVVEVEMLSGALWDVVFLDEAFQGE